MRHLLAIVALALLAGCEAPTRAERLDERGRHQRKPERAIEDFSQAIDLEPSRAEFWLHRGDARARLSDWDGAIADYSESIRLEPSARAHLHRARARRQKHLLDLALVDVEAAVELDADFEASAEKERERIRAQMEPRK